MSAAWIVAVAMLAFSLVAIALVTRHHQREKRRGRTGWTRGDLFGLLAVVMAIVTGLAPFVFHDDSGASSGSQTSPPAPSSAGADMAGEVGRLQEGDVSLFTEVLGDPGYRRPIERLVNGAVTDVEGMREWGWARSEEFMVRAMVDDAEQVRAFSVTTLSGFFRPDIAYLADLAEEPLRLGETTFADFAGAFDVPFPPTAIRGIGLTAQGRWHYAEIYDAPRPLFRQFTMMHGSTGDLATEVATFDQITEVFEQLGACALDSCSPGGIDSSPLLEVRGIWPITTVTVYEEDFPVELEGSALAAEPLDVDVAAADRG